MPLVRVRQDDRALSLVVAGMLFLACLQLALSLRPERRQPLRLCRCTLALESRSERDIVVHVAATDDATRRFGFRLWPLQRSPRRSLLYRPRRLRRPDP